MLPHESLDSVLTALFCTFNATDISACPWSEISCFKHVDGAHTYIAANGYQDTDKCIESNIVCLWLLCYDHISTWFAGLFVLA